MRVIAKKILALGGGRGIIELRVEAPHIAQKAQAGQFVMVMVSSQGERIPLTIVGHDSDSITLIFQEAGFVRKIVVKINIKR